MIKTANKQKDNTGASIRRRLSAAICMLLIATIMLVTSTYAWFTLSTAPEVRGINTSVAGNGSLEIALMPSSGTFSNITSGRGASGTEYGGLKEMTAANNSWGNVVNLKDPSYGLDLITLNPVQFNLAYGTHAVPVYQTNPETGEILLDGEDQPIPATDPETGDPLFENVKDDEPSDAVQNPPFFRPAFGYDGRIMDLRSANFKSKADGEGFDSDNYGVRAIVDEGGSTYGYAIDLAFRLNSVSLDETTDTVSTGKLLLQTEGAQRIYADGNATATQGGGSRLWFQDENGNDVAGVDEAIASQYLKVIRIAFIQNLGNADQVSLAKVLCYAKPDPNTGYLSLCDYKGDLLTGDDANVILATMTKNQAYQISAVLWLDGTQVTNANMAIDNTVLSKATLNLQFATDVSLVPAENANVRNNPPSPIATETSAETTGTTEAPATTSSTAAPVEP